MTSLRAVVSVHLDHQLAPIIKCMTTTRANANALLLSNVQVGRRLIHILVNVGALNQDLSAHTHRNMTVLHVDAPVSIDHKGALIQRHLTMTRANVSVPISSNALEDRRLIRILASVNVQDQGLLAPKIKNMTKLRVGAHAQSVHNDVPTIKHSTTILVHVVVPTQSNVQVDRGLIQTPVDVSAPHQGHSVPTPWNTMALPVGAPVSIDHKGVPIHRPLIMTPANVSVLTQSNALEDRRSIQIPVSVSVQDQGLLALVLKNMMKSHVDAHVQIDHRDAPTIKPMITIDANAAVQIQSNVRVDRGLIQIPVDVSALRQGHSVPTLRNMTM